MYSPMSDDELRFPEGYVARMQAGPVDDHFLEALGSLSTEQRAHLARLLGDRVAPLDS